MSTTSPPEIRARFAQRLRALRIPRGYRTARAFAEALGIDENRYTRYERAEVEPDLTLLVRICKLLGIGPNDLLGETESNWALSPSSSAGLPGFAEPAVALDDTGRGTSHRARRAGLAAWSLAEHLVLSTPSAAVLSPMDRLARIAQLNGDIVADPLAFATRLPASPQMQALDRSAKEQAANLTTAMIEAYRAE